MAFGDGMGLFPVYVGPQIRVGRDVNAADDSIQVPPGSESDLVSLDGLGAADGQRLMSVRPALQGEGDDDDIVVTPEAIEAAQGIVMSPDNVGTRRGRSVVRRRAKKLSPQISTAVERVAKKFVARMRSQMAKPGTVTAPFAEDDFVLTPGSMAVDEGEGESDAVLSGMAGAGLGKVSRRIVALRRQTKKLKRRVKALEAQAAPGAQVMPSEPYPGQQYLEYQSQYQPQYAPQYAPQYEPQYDQYAYDPEAVAVPAEGSEVVSMEEVDSGPFVTEIDEEGLFGLGEAIRRKVVRKVAAVAARRGTPVVSRRVPVARKSAKQPARKRAVEKLKSTVLQMAEVAGYPEDKLPILIQGRGYNGAVKVLRSIAKLKSKQDIRLYKDSLKSVMAGGDLSLEAQAVVSATPDAFLSIAPFFPTESPAPAYPPAMFQSGSGLAPSQYPPEALDNAEPAVAVSDPEVVTMHEVDRATFQEAEQATRVPYGNAGGEDFDIDAAPELPGGEAAEPRYVYPSGALDPDELEPEEGEESAIFDDVDIPVGFGDAKFMGDPMRDGFMSSPPMNRRKYDTIGDAGMPKGVKAEREDIYEQESADQIDAMSRPPQLAQGNFAGRPYKAGESMIPFGRSLRGKRVDILDTSVVGLSPDRVQGQKTISPTGMDPNLLVDGEPVSLELSDEGFGMGQLPSFGSLAFTAIDNTMTSLKAREQALLTISPAGYEAAVAPYAALRTKLSTDYEAMRADNSKATALGISWGASAATYKNVLDRAISAARAAQQKPRTPVLTRTKEIIREVPRAAKETIFSKYGLAVAIGGAAVLGGLFYLRSKQK